MRQTALHPKEATLNLRIDAVLKAEFTAEVEAEERPAAEARRQSQLIAASEDEAEVMRWIQDVSELPDESLAGGR